MRDLGRSLEQSGLPMEVGGLATYTWWIWAQGGWPGRKDSQETGRRGTNGC